MSDTVFEIILYRDEPPEGNVESRVMPDRYDSVEEAITHAREAGVKSEWYYWSAVIDEVRRVRRQTEPGVWITEFQDMSHGRRWYVGPDWERWEVR